METPFEATVLRCLAWAFQDEAFFSSYVCKIDSALEDDASTDQFVQLAKDVMREMIDNEWIELIQHFEPGDMVITLPKPELVDYVMKRWEALDYKKDLEITDVVWYRLTPKGEAYLKTKPAYMPVLCDPEEFDEILTD